MDLGELGRGGVAWLRIGAGTLGALVKAVINIRVA
jgi:hypothetical protein